MKTKYGLTLAVAVSLIAFIVSVHTTRAYCDPASMGMTTFGEQSQTVRALQQCLIGAGFTIPAGATGYFGEQTRGAVKNFYRSALGMGDWDGNSVGPVGRAKLATLGQGSGGTTVTVATPAGYKTAGSVEVLLKYVSAEQSYGMSNFARTTSLEMTTADAALPSAPQATASGAEKSEPGRVSETNVQIAGIDEPDIVKTDGQHLYVSRVTGWYRFDTPMPAVIFNDAITLESERSVAPPANPTVVIDAYPVDELQVVSESIPETGEMLLVKDKQVLIILSHPKIVAYDVKNPKSPVKLWEKTLEDNTSIVTARLLDGTIYVVTGTYLNRSYPCPITPLRSGTQSLTLPCGSVLVPEQIEPVSHAYTLMKIEPKTGAVSAESAVTGDSQGVTIMMSQNSLYLASRADSERVRIMAEVILDGFTPYVPATVVAKAKTILTYDISESGKLNEISKLFEGHLQTLTADERLRIQNEVENRLQEGLKKRLRDMIQSRIVRIDLDTLKVEATGMVPGYLLNQFAMDEYEGNLRVAVTVDDGWGGAESVNDVYVLNANLTKVGHVQDLGLTERIYAVRFMGDTAYVVTFRQIDPFYVLDLSVPTAPTMVGELKIPGYSAYLEYLGNDLVLGVGREGSGVKLSIFDVSNPAKPTEKSKYQLSDSWTEVENNHRAFLRDEKHKVFFIPGGQGGYIFSYQNGTLTLKKALSGYNVKRALYIDDNMYVVSEDKIRVLDENTWEQVKEISI